MFFLFLPMPVIGPETAFLDNFSYLLVQISQALALPFGMDAHTLAFLPSIVIPGTTLALSLDTHS
jgi:hypothetical protein